MKAIQLLHARNTISRQKQRLCQELVFVILVENIAFDKLVEAHWSGEDKVWHTLRAEYHSSDGANREVWRAQTSFSPSDDASLPGDIEFALRYRVLGEDYWDNNESRNYFSNADSGVLLEQNVQLLNIDFNPILQDGQRHYPITVAVRQSLQPKHVFVHWTTDNWRSTQVTPCFFHRMYWDKWHRSSAGAAPGSRIDMMQAFGSASSRSTMHFAFSTRSAVIRRAGRSGTTTLGATTSPATAG